ncbi:hypothetical protein GCM10022419_024480 [Nonomuraea rosea]|uniref:Uncharacterized protein n=1 Tax=Nonomuraea rosea TaxID=638574 RepID=A0ABP6VYB3_9ACTN
MLHLLGIVAFGKIRRIMGDTFAALLPLVFIAIIWAVLASVIESVSKHTRRGRPRRAQRSALSSVAIAGLVIGGALVVYLGLTDGSR